MERRTKAPYRAGLFGAVLLGGVIFGAALVGTAVLVGCSAGSSTADDRSVVRVFAAASLADAFERLESAFEDANPQYDVELNLAGSSSLRAQILDGAPVDVFASANVAIMDDVAGEPSAQLEQPQIFTTNELLIAVPQGNPATVIGVADFARPELFLGLCAAEVPCGSLAERALAAAGIEPSIDTREPDVRALLGKVADGELDAGIVYRTDVLAATDRVESIEIDTDNSSQTISANYPIAVAGGGHNPTGGRAFVSFVLGDDGRQILTDHGFGQP